MQEYLRILKNVLENGQSKQPVRRGPNGEIIPVENGTVGTFCEIFRHNMDDGFPLITTKKMAFKSIRVELEGFIKGVTDKKWFQDRGCKIWDEWCKPELVPEYVDDNCKLVSRQESDNFNPDYLERSLLAGKYRKTTKAEKDKFALYEDDLGPIYGYQWRRFGQEYYHKDEREWRQYSPGVLYGKDQLKSIVDQLHANPYDRRMLCSAWNPNQMHMMALPPCHYAWNVVVYGDRLNLVWNQRSCDIFLGVPFNIASYAMLLLLLAKEANLKPGELVGTLHDCHIYDNQINQAKLQLTRDPYDLPKVSIVPMDGRDFSIFNWTWEDVVIANYKHHPAIKAEVTV
jgi:thymidylate synthase